MKLAEFLAASIRREFKYGETDCGLWLADWVLERTGIDGAEALRGRYSTAKGCARVLRRAGGLVAVVDACAAAAGLSRTDSPVTGDIGVVEALTASGPQACGAIRTGPRWTVLAPDGLIAAPLPLLAAWKV